MTETAPPFYAVQPIGPPVFADPQPVPPPADALPEFAWLPLGQLRVRCCYQREISGRSRKVVRRGIEEFSWSRFKVLNVARIAEDEYEVLDGQHSAMILLASGLSETAPCLISRECDIAAAAADFVSLNGNRTQLSPMQKFRAELAAGDPLCSLIQKAADDAGVRILQRPNTIGYRPGELLSVATLKSIATKRGGENLTRLLRLLEASGLAPIDKPMLQAVDLLLFEEEFAGAAADAVLAATIAQCGDGARAAAVRAKSEHKIPLKRGLAVALSIRARQGRSRAA